MDTRLNMPTTKQLSFSRKDSSLYIYIYKGVFKKYYKKNRVRGYLKL